MNRRGVSKNLLSLRQRKNNNHVTPPRKRSALTPLTPRVELQRKNNNHVTPPRKRSALTPLTPRVELTPLRDNVFTLNLDSVPLFENPPLYLMAESTDDSRLNINEIEHEETRFNIMVPVKDNQQYNNIEQEADCPASIPSNSLEQNDDSRLNINEIEHEETRFNMVPVKDNQQYNNIEQEAECPASIPSNSLEQNDDSHLYMTEILKEGDIIRMCDVNLLYSPVQNLIGSNIVTLKCKRQLEFQSLENIPEENMPACVQDKLGKTIQETTNISEKCVRKQHFCPFCKKFQFAFGRHVLAIHKNEQIVQNILKYPKNSLQRRKELSLLRGKGMHIYNMENKEKHAPLVVRKPKKSDPNTFVPCPNCTAYFLPRNLARHHKDCVKRPPNRMRVLKMATNLRNSVDDTLLSKLLSDLKQDDITETILVDKTLLLLASSMSIKYAREKHLGCFIRQRLRQLSRLLIVIRQIDPTVQDFKSCLIPQKYDTIRNAVYKLCELDTITFTYKKPSLATQLGGMIKDCVNALKLDNIKNGLNDTEHQKHLDDFLLVHEKEYGSLVARSALSTLAQNKWNKTQVFPSVADIQIFQEYIKTRAKGSFNYLKSNGFSYDEWLCLARSCLLMLLTFNRRRVGEISRVLITNYENRQSISDEQLPGLNRLECILASTFERMEIRGKKGRRVPVLLTKSHVEYIDMILKMRDKAGIPNSNPYLFGVNSKIKHIDAGVVIREFSVKCGASNSDTLRGTYLRKQVATISQMLNLNDNEIQQLADFMGHDVAIHKLHYRQPEISLQITKLAKFFMVAGETNMDKYKGKTLDELQANTDQDNEVNDKEAQSSSEDEDKISSHQPSLNLNTISHRTHSDNSPVSPQRPSSSSKSVYYTTPTKTPTKKRKQNDSDYSPDVTPQKRKYSFQTWDSSPVKRVPHKRVAWSKVEKNIIFNEFKKFLETKTLPSFLECEALRNKYKPQLNNRTGVQIKAFVNNTNKKKTFD